MSGDSHADLFGAEFGKQSGKRPFHRERFAGRGLRGRGRLYSGAAGADTAGSGGVWGYPHRPEGGAVRLAGIRKAGHGPRQAPEGLSAGDRRQDACLFGGDDGRSHFGGAAGV